MTDPKSAESVLQVRVYYEDTDAGGVVFYANYLKFLERARTEWLRNLGVNQSNLAVSEQRLFVVRSLDMSYRKPARLDDLLTIRSRVTRLGRASIHFAQRAERDGELLAEGNIQVCCVDAIHMRPAELPADVRAKLEFIQE
ncbi:tol-pal system-associated acyl-CoA thioesterase [Achromobacter xylosoxidans A8]|uniref:Tol-pal system-associated acyl-CoA thioesterase n=1 Tax=Achromobacter xylosoxidans (strain A8) TaxID=762376 RepID=E3HFE7_ACHXA|nr:tol-pal system-associated acyl-CoA thioesterase [Achromobacter xylosoxidans]ADP14103.1 tol-pal system-associated acyl-CoA thioesterase [Achromobacter xylosoxidans A8]